MFTSRSTIPAPRCGHAGAACRVISLSDGECAVGGTAPDQLFQRISIQELDLGLLSKFSRLSRELITLRCSSRQIVITFLAPNQRTGNVAHLFDQSAKI